MDKFGGDGLMAVFGALITLKDHAIRAYLPAHGLQNEIQRVADDVLRRYGSGCSWAWD